MTSTGLQCAEPPRSLCGIVKGFWMACGSAKEDSPRVINIPACSRFGIIAPFRGRFYFRDPDRLLRAYSKTFFVGIRTKSAEITAVGDYGLFGVVFHPNMYRHLNLTAPKDLVDCNISVSDVLGSSGTAFEERLHLARTFEGKTAVASEFLGNHFRKREIVKDKFDLLVDGIHGGLFRQGVEETAQACNMSVRHFHRRFKDAMGVSPKRYNRIIRFRKALDALNSTYNLENPAAVAYRFGYADQAHFIREFSEFSGAAPLRFLKASSRNPMNELIEDITDKFKVV